MSARDRVVGGIGFRIPAAAGSLASTCCVRRGPAQTAASS